MALVSTSCDAPPRQEEVVVYAAASTRDVLLELSTAFEREHNVELVFNFGGSGDLARQIIAAGKANLFFSADEIEMERVEQAGLLEDGTRRAILSNHLVVIEPADSPPFFGDNFDVARLRDTAVHRISVADVATVPAGRYAREWLQKAGIWDSISEKIVPAIDVRAALSAVEFGAAEVGIVYQTDANMSKLVRTVYRVPENESPIIRYVIAIIRGKASNASQAFVDYLSSDSAADVFSKYGFVRQNGLK